MANHDARSTPPRWFRPVAVIALLWNVLGCVAYLADVTMKPEDIAKLTEAQRGTHGIEACVVHRQRTAVAVLVWRRRLPHPA